MGFGIALRSISRISLVSLRQISSSNSLFAKDRFYTKRHEWVVVEDNVGTVGISTFAQEQLGDVVYVELPDVGKQVSIGESVGAVESVKAASDIYSPVSGEVTAKNNEVEDNPALINKSPYDNGWLFKLSVKNIDELKELMDEETYEKFKKSEEEKD